VRHEVLVSNLPEAPLAPLFVETTEKATAIVS
jgi:hypothetical protein